MTLTPVRIETSALDHPASAWEYGSNDGFPLILVHGFRGDHHGLERIALHLADFSPALRIVVPDLPGFGATAPVSGRHHDLELYGEWLRDFASKVFGDREFAVAGHSFGSLIVSNAISQGLAPAGLGLISPISSPALAGPNRVMTQLAIAYYRAADRLPRPASHALLSHPAIVRVMSETMAKTLDPELRSWIHGEHRAHFSSFSDPATLLEAFHASVSHTVADYVADLNLPALIIAGERDTIAPLTHQLALHRKIPDSQLHIFPGVGHLVHYEAASDAAELLHAFVTEISSELRTEAGEGST